MRHNGDQWEELSGSATSGGISGTDYHSWAPDMELDNQGHPVIAWSEYGMSGTTEPHRGIRVSRYDGVAWLDLSDPATLDVTGTTGWSERPSLALASGGSPVVAWEEPTPQTREIYLKRYDGFAWLEHSGSASEGGVSNSSAESYAPSVSVVGNAVCVAWSENTTGGPKILIRCSDL